MPHIVVLATGGTIAAMRGADGALTPVLDASELLAFAPRADIDVEAHQLMSVDSAAMTPADIGGIAARIVRDAAGADGVVVLHGTDTMAESALAADLALARAGHRVPAVFTGAQRSADHPDPDGPPNLALAFEAASEPHAGSSAPDAGSAALAFAGTILPAWGTRKVHTRELDGFAAPPDQAAAAAARARALTVLRRLEGPGSAAPPRADPPRVDTVAVYPGADGAAFSAFRAVGARGIVVEALGAGNANAAVVEAARGAVADGVPVVVTTRVPRGPVVADYGGGGGGANFADAGAAFSPILRAGQARVLLAELLGAGAGVADVTAAFG